MGQGGYPHFELHSTPDSRPWWLRLGYMFLTVNGYPWGTLRGHRKPAERREPRLYWGRPTGYRGQFCVEPRPRQSHPGAKLRQPAPMSPQDRELSLGVQHLPLVELPETSVWSGRADSFSSGLGATSGPSCHFSLPKEPLTAPASLDRGLRPFTHLQMLGPQT